MSELETTKQSFACQWDQHDQCPYHIRVDILDLNQGYQECICECHSDAFYFMNRNGTDPVEA